MIYTGVKIKQLGELPLTLMNENGELETTHGFEYNNIFYVSNEIYRLLEEDLLKGD